MSLVTRATNILANPRMEWPRIDSEPTSSGNLMLGYALPLALLPFLGTIVGAILFTPPGFGMIGAGFWTAILVTALLGIVLGLAILFVMSLIADALAPNFGGVRNPIGALKLLVYSSTATWVAGALSFIPVLGFLLWLLAFAYAAYLIYLGSVSVMKVPPSSAAGYTAVVIIIWILLSIVVTFIIGLVVATLFIGAAAVGGAGYMLR